MNKQNCWEHKKCGREPGGAKTHEVGVCPAAQEVKAHGINGGAKGGRACWPIAGTLCGGKVQGTFAMKVQNCQSCDFYTKVQQEEGTGFTKAKDILEKLK
jgi:hypothetical protein